MHGAGKQGLCSLPNVAGLLLHFRPALLWQHGGTDGSSYMADQFSRELLEAAIAGLEAKRERVA